MGHMLILFIVAGLTKTSLSSIITIPVSRKVLIFAGIIIAIAIITIVSIKKLRRKARKVLVDLRRDISKLLREPGRFAFALVCAMLITSLYAGALYFCAQSAGQTITVLQAFFVLTVGVTAASVTPTPGGIGGAEAGLVAGFVSIGMDSSTALSISLIYRLITFWLPIVPGFIAFHHASEKKYI
jgi:undecaprenyl-diphosphatase